MSSSIESTWDLRCDSIPRSLAVDIAPSIGASSTLGSGSISNSGGQSRPSPSYKNSASSVVASKNAALTRTKISGAANSGTNAATTSRSAISNKVLSTNPFDELFERNSQQQQQLQRQLKHEAVQGDSADSSAALVAGAWNNVSFSSSPPLVSESVSASASYEDQQFAGDSGGRDKRASKNTRKNWSKKQNNTNPFDDDDDYNDGEDEVQVEQEQEEEEEEGKEYNHRDNDDDEKDDVVADAATDTDNDYNTNANRHNEVMKKYSKSLTTSGYSVLIGTELGTMQYRTFPSPAQIQKNKNAFSSMDTTVSPFGYDGTALDRVHPIYQPLNVESETQKKSPMVACIRAFRNTVAKSNVSSSSTTSAFLPLLSSSSYMTKKRQDHSTLSASRTSSIYLTLFNNHRGGVSDTSMRKKNDDDDNNRKKSSHGAYSSQIVALHHLTNSYTIIFSSMALPTMSCATYHPNTGFVYAAGKSICSLPPDVVRTVSSAVVASSASVSGTSRSGDIAVGSSSISSSQEDILARPNIYYDAVDLLPAEVRSNPDAICTACKGRIVVIACGNTFYAVSGTCVPHGTWFTKEEEEQIEEAKATAAAATSDATAFAFNNCHIVRGISGEDDGVDDGYGFRKGHDVEKVLKFRQSSQVHPAIVVEVPDNESSNYDEYSEGKNHCSISLEQEVFTSQLFLASGRECAVVDILYNPRLYSNTGYNKSTSMGRDVDDMNHAPSPSSVSCGSIVAGPPRHGVATLASPILSAVGIKWNAKRCGPLMAILTNDGLVQTRSPSCISIPLSTIEVGTNPNDYFVLRALPDKHVVAASYGGEGKLISFREDTVQDFSNRMVKLSVDAFGSNGFPRAELAEAVNAKFSATSYVGPEPTNSARTILKQYLEMVLGLDKHDDLGGSDKTSWLFGVEGDGENGLKPFSDQNSQGTYVREPHASVLVAATAIICLACSRISPPNPSLANRAAKSCAAKLGVVCNIQDCGINTATVRLCKKVMEYLLEETKSSSVENTFSTPTRSKVSNRMEFLEAAIWLLRSCAEHVLAIEVTRNSFDLSQTRQSGSWSQLKYESFLATHLGELWSHGDDSCRDAVLSLPTTRELLETNPLLGLGIFTSSHPKNSATNSTSSMSTDYAKKVIEVLKGIRPLARDKRERGDQVDVSSYSDENNSQLPLESGRALTVTYLESLVGLSKKKPLINLESSNTLGEMHNELALLLLEGVLAEQCDDESEGESQLGSIYRSKLRRLLGWSNAVNPDALMSVLPKSFLRERALVLGQLGRHEDALRIFYCQLDSLDLALEYCDVRFEKISASIHSPRGKGDASKLSKPSECPYIPLISVALKTHGDSDRGIESAIKVLSLRRDKIDRSAALRLLPKNIPISSLSQSFLVPALIDSESQARRMEVVAALLRAKYVRLKRTLTETQIKSQSSIHTVPGLRSLNLGQPIYTSKSFKARPSSLSPNNFPDISITKYFFPRYVVIQASVFDCTPQMRDKSLGNVQLVVAESSEDALLPSIHIPIKTLPSGMTGSSWCVLAASPQRLDVSAILTCELRYNIIEVDSTTGAPLSFNGGYGISSKSVVEEIQDIVIRRAEFEGLARLD